MIVNKSIQTVKALENYRDLYIYVRSLGDKRAIVEAELRNEIANHYEVHFERTYNDFKKKGNLDEYIERVETKAKIIREAPEDLREYIQEQNLVFSLYFGELASKRGWEVVRRHAEFDRELNKTGTTWQELPFIGNLRRYFTDEEIEDVLSFNGVSLDVWSDDFCLSLDESLRFSFVDVELFKNEIKKRLELRENHPSNRWAQILYALTQCHNEVFELFKNKNPKFSARDLATTVCDAVSSLFSVGNNVLINLADYHGRDFHRAIYHFTKYIAIELDRADTDEARKNLVNPYHDYKAIIRTPLDSIVVKPNKIPVGFRAPINDNVFTNKLLNNQKEREIVIRTARTDKYEPSAVVVKPDVDNNPEIDNFDILVYYAIREICEKNDPVKGKSGFYTHVVRIAEIVNLLFGVRADNATRGDACYDTVFESVRKLINFRVTYDATHFFDTRKFDGLAKLENAQMITGDIGVSRYYDNDKSKDLDTLFVYQVHRFYELLVAFGKKNSIKYCKAFFPKNIRSKDMIYLVTIMLSRASWKGKSKNKVRKTPLYSVNNIRVTDDAFSLFGYMERFGWVDISKLGRGETTRELRRKDQTQRQKVQKVLDHWIRTGLFGVEDKNGEFGVIRTNKKTDKDKLEWYEAQIDLDALNNHFSLK